MAAFAGRYRYAPVHCTSPFICQYTRSVSSDPSPSHSVIRAHWEKLLIVCTRVQFARAEMLDFISFLNLDTRGRPSWLQLCQYRPISFGSNLRMFFQDRRVHPSSRTGCGGSLFLRKSSVSLTSPSNASPSVSLDLIFNVLGLSIT